jgi:hypothetical protein
MRKTILAAALLLGATPALAQTAATPDCRDDNGAERCSAAARQKLLGVFGAEAIERLSAGGSTVLRAFFIDGYGREQALVSLMRPRGGDAEIVVAFPMRDGSRPAELRAAVPQNRWDALMRQARFFDRTLVPLDGKSADICLHSWMVTVESAGVAQRGSGAVRRQTQDTCNDGLAADTGFALAEAAAALLPPCDALKPEQHRNAVARLGACAMLSGDRLAAAGAMNQFNSNWFRAPRDAGQASTIAYLFHDQAELQWAGAALVRGGLAAAQDWATRMAQLHFWPQRFTGLDADHVRIDAVIEEVPADGDYSKRRTAKAVQLWTRENGFDFRLRSMTVGAFARP